MCLYLYRTGKQSWFTCDFLRQAMAENAFCPALSDRAGSLAYTPKLWKMVQLAETLAVPLKFARIDFYDINGEIYFGEITFFPGNGMEEFSPEKWDYRIGEWLEL